MTPAGVPELQVGGRRRDLLTPEGVVLSFEIGSVGDRLLAAVIDLGLIAAATLICGLIAIGLGSESAIGLLLIVAFMLRNFYFMLFEGKWRGSTPGKRARGLRVVDAAGGQLAVEAVIVRNLTREVELFLPLTVMMVPDLLGSGGPGWSLALTVLWLLIAALMPLFNRERRRLGDLAAGTLVIRMPLVTLLGDVADESRRRVPTPVSSGDFTAEQLSHYGIYELQVLEEVLRRHRTNPDPATLEGVAGKIREKIGRRAGNRDAESFLRAFYAAQRAHLERKLLFGKRRQDKHDRAD